MTVNQLCYAVEGNTVDRASQKNGRGWCENVSPTLNTQDRHAICFQLCRDRDNPSVSVSDKAYCIPANPRSDRGQALCFALANSASARLSINERSPTIKAARCDEHAVCIALEGNGARPSHRGNGYCPDGSMYTLNTIEHHSVCYEEKKNADYDI